MNTIPVLFEAYTHAGKVVRLNKMLHVRPMKGDFIDIHGYELVVEWCKIMPIGMKVFVQTREHHDFNGWTQVESES